MLFPICKNPLHEVKYYCLYKYIHMEKFMNSLKLRHSLLLILTAFIWGVAFVAQSSGGDACGPYTFNCIRSFIGSLVLIPVIFFLNKGKGKSD